jgi:hypothetical protein
MIDTDNAKHLTPDEALAGATKLTRVGQTSCLAPMGWGCVLDEIDREILEDLFGGLAEYLHRSGERDTATTEPKGGA